MADSQQSENETLSLQYTSGIWYDLRGGEFCQLRETSEGEVAFYKPDEEPEEDSPYQVVPAEKWTELVERDFYKINKETIKNPIETFVRVDDKTNLSLPELYNYRWAERMATVEKIDNYDAQDYL